MRALAALGWIAVHVLRLLWHILAALGSRWAKKKLASSDADRTKNPVVRAFRRRRIQHSATSTQDTERTPRT